MSISAPDIAIIVIYLLVVLAVGVYQALKIRTSGDYYAGGRKFGKFYMMMHALSQASDADEPVSVMGGAYQKGLSGIWYTYLYFPLTPIFWLLAPYIRRTRFLTTADFFEYRYDRSLSFLYALTGVLKMSLAIGLVLKSTSVIFDSMTGGTIDVNWAIFVMTVIFVVYGFAGGLRATVVTESLQGPLIVVMSLLLLPFGLAAVGGFGGLHETLPTSFFHFTAPGDEFTPLWIAASSATALIGFISGPQVVSLFASGKTELEGRIGYTYGTMIKRLCAIGWVFTGVIVAALVAQGDLPPAEAARLEQDRELAFGAAMRALLPIGFIGVMFAAIFASQMAALSSRMVNASALASRNLYLAFVRPDAGDREVLWVGRIAGLFLVALGVLLATRVASVADALTAFLQFSAIMGVVMWGGIFWRRANVPGAWAAVIALFIPWLTFGPAGTMIRDFLLERWPGMSDALPTWIGMYGRARYVPELMAVYLPPGVVALVVVSLLTKPPPRKKVDDFRMLLRTPVGQEQKLIDAGVKIIYAGSTTPNPLETKHPHLVHWGGAAIAAAVCAVIVGLLMWLAQLGSG
jgi:Na+/proline symporter